MLMADACIAHLKLLTARRFATARQTTKTGSATGIRMSTHEAMKEQDPDSGVHSGQKLQKWSESLNIFQNFLETHEGRYPTKKENPSLYAWVASQRNAHREGKLSSTQINALEQCGFIWNKQDYEWDIKFQMYCEFLKQNNGKDPSQRCTDEPEHTLAVWLLRVRSSYRDNTLKTERERRLKAIGFKFDPMDESWKNMLDKLRAFKRAHLAWPGIRPKDADEKQLAQWLKFQIRAYNRGTMSVEKRQLLDELDFKTYREREPAPDLAWRENFNKIATYRSRHGHLPKTKTWQKSAEKNEIDQLCSWLTIQRDKYAEGTLAAWQIESLKSVGFEFKKLGQINHEKWESKYESVKTFLQTHQREPRDHGPDQHERLLGKWLR